MTLMAWLAVLLASSPAARAAPGEDANALLRAADEALARGDHAAAADGFAASYRALSPELQHGPVGGRTIALAFEAYREAWHRAREPAPLRAARALLQEHRAGLERTGKAAAVEETAQRLGWIEHLLELEDARTRVSEPPTCPEPPPAELPVCPEPAAIEPAPTEPAPIEPAPRRDALGLGLTIGGAEVLLGGVGLLVGGSRMLPAARRQVEASGRDPDDPVPQDEVYLQEYRDRGRALMIAGGVVAGVGAAVTAWGVVRLVQGRRQARGPQEPGIGVSVSPRAILLRARF